MISFFKTGPINLTLGTAIWAVVLVLAIACRGLALSASPLNDTEGPIAFSAWQLLHGQLPLDWQEPITIILSAIGLFFFGSSDFVARLVPFFAGSALLVLVYWTRPFLGRPAALGAVMLLAFSPSFVFFSRFLSGDIMAVLIAAVLIVVLSRIGATPGRRNSFGIALLLALLLNSGPTGWTLLLAVLFAFAGLYAAGYLPAVWLSKANAVLGKPADSVKALAVFVSSFLILGNLFRPWNSPVDVLGLADWLGQFGLNQGARPALSFQALMSYEPWLVLSGLASVAVLLRSKNLGLTKDEIARRLFLLFWSLFAAFVFLLSNREHAGSVLAVLFPLSLLGGDSISRLFSGVREMRWSHVLLTMVLVAIILVYLWMVAAQAAAGTLNPAWVIVPLTLVAAGVILLSVLVAIHLEGRRALAPVGILFTIILGVYAIHSIAWVSRSGPHELVVKSVVSPEVRGLAGRLALDAGKPAAPDLTTVVVAESLRPSLVWYLRDSPGLTFVRGVGPGALVAILPAEQMPGWPGYVQDRIRINDRWRPEGLSWSGLWRWLAYRDAYGTVNSEYGVILLKKDLSTSP